MRGFYLAIFLALSLSTSATFAAGKTELTWYGHAAFKHTLNFREVNAVCNEQRLAIQFRATDEEYFAVAEADGEGGVQ